MKGGDEKSIKGTKEDKVNKMRCPFVMKICSKCNTLLVANYINFQRRKDTKDGLRNDCKKCHNKMTKKHREENKGYYKEYHKKWNEENKDIIKEQKKKYYKENKEEINKKHKEYYKKNPDKVFNWSNKYRQLKERQGSGITKEQWLEMMLWFDFRCAYSGEYIGGDCDYRTIDHIIPLSKGGENEIWNLVPMFRNYNCSKQSNEMFSWYIQQEYFSEERLIKIYEWCEYAWNKWGDETMSKRKFSWYHKELNEKNIQLLINFKKHLIPRGLKEQTIHQYLKDIGILMEYLQRLNIRTLDVTNRDIREYLDTLNVSAPRKIRIICVLNLFYSHNAKKGYCENPMKDIDTSELREQLKKGDSNDK